MFNFDLNPEKMKVDRPFFFFFLMLIVLGLIIWYSASHYMAEALYRKQYRFITG